MSTWRAQRGETSQVNKFSRQTMGPSLLSFCAELTREQLLPQVWWDRIMPSSKNPCHIKCGEDCPYVEGLGVWHLLRMVLLRLLFKAAWHWLRQRFVPPRGSMKNDDNSCGHSNHYGSESRDDGSTNPVARHPCQDHGVLPHCLGE
mmetsp:Transcript_118715/g.236450  ORF Transcript_118715/g.236450 Transcript_118715/m.236450 type:complete len:146 (+) Transcript_118715:113-550(+)